MGTVSLTLRVAVFLYFNKILSDSFGSSASLAKNHTMPHKRVVRKMATCTRNNFLLASN